MKKFLDHFRNCLAFIAAILFFLIFILVIMEILCRTFLGFSLLWTTDFIQLVVCWTLAFGMSVIVYSDDHLKMDVIIRKTNKKSRNILKVVTELIELVFFAMLVPFGIKTAITKMSILFTTLRWPMGYMYAALPMFGILCTIFMLYRVVNTIRGLTKGEGG